jgi:hypothetical protein
MQQHPGRGGVGHWRISEACKHTVSVWTRRFFGAAKGYKTKGGKVEVERDARPTLPLLPPSS